jgi:hypothetical protein
MIHFLHSHPTFLEDLHEATIIMVQGNKNSDHVYSICQSITKAHDELLHFEAVVGWVDPLHKDNVFRLNVGDAKSSWKRWQDNCYTIAKKYDGYLFTYGSIKALVQRLNEQAAKFKNGQTIKEPDWTFCWEYNIRPSISIGDNCTLVFEAVRGYYDIEEGSHE